jgi:hypothetical protein
VRRVDAWEAEQDRLERHVLQQQGLEIAAAKLDAARIMISKARGDIEGLGRPMTPLEAARVAEVGGRLAETARSGGPSGGAFDLERVLILAAERRTDARMVTD